MPKQGGIHAWEGHYLIWTRPDARGFLSIGLLVLAFTTGGQSGEQQTIASHSTPEQPIESHQPATDTPQSDENAPPAIEEVSFFPLSQPVDGIVTHYGAQYNGQPLGCGSGVYASEDASILAVGPARDWEWPCGTLINVCGPNGCVLTVRQDSCPGCSASHVDLSEAGIARVCGEGVPLCRVELQAMREVRVMVMTQQEAPSQSDDAVLH